MAAEFLRINHNALFAKLNALNIVQVGDMKLIPCGKFIECVSSAESRDKRIISDFTQEEVILYNRKRHFTPAGVLRYIEVGHLVNYKNVCDWLNVKPDPYYQYNRELKKMMRDNQYVTQSLNKFLFGKIRTIHGVGPTCQLSEFLDCLTLPLQTLADPDKLEFLQKKIQCKLVS